MKQGGNNLYQFVSNNPVNSFDPHGLSGWMDMRGLPGDTGPSTLVPSPILLEEEDIVNFGGGLGDSVSCNLTKVGRNAIGIDNVDRIP